MSIELQKELFEKKVSRRWLVDYVPESQNRYKIQVFRNHSFELIEHTIHAYLDYADMAVDFSYSGYDDSFSFTELKADSDLIIIWVDLERYKDVNVNQYFSQRIVNLRGKYSGPVLIAAMGGNIGIKEPGVVEYSFESIHEKLGEKFYDRKNCEITGTNLSNKAMLLVSQELGLRYIPSLILTPLKAIVVDLDNTLYKGVLGEDGIEGIEVTEGHRKLQKLLKKKSEEGFFVCVASKNEYVDVEELFNKRRDFEIGISDFTKVMVSWNAKAESIKEIANFLNIGMDSIVFVDDNIGELYAVKAEIPSIHLIHATDDANLTSNILFNYPRLEKYSETREDKFRKQDTIANELRHKLQAELSEEDYVKSLGIKLDYKLNCQDQIARISQLSNKTNQFIFNYKRYSEQDILERIERDDYAVISVSLSDKLSDSGLICCCIGKKLPGEIEIEECFMSCRALGRGIDNIIIGEAIKGICKTLHCNNVRIDFRNGPRNMPAEKYLDKYFSEFKNKTSIFRNEEKILNVEIIRNY